jgi:hypothetical protein
MCHRCCGYGTIVTATESGDGAVVTCPACEGRKPDTGWHALAEVVDDIERFIAIQRSPNVIRFPIERVKR